MTETGNDQRDKETSGFEQYEESAERFQSDTRRYLMEHLLDEYPSAGQAIEYNFIQNVNDNLIPNQRVSMKFVYSSKDKRFQFIVTGYKGIQDWDRYNGLHKEGKQGVARRGEGAKVLIPIAKMVRTETNPIGGNYLQAVWIEDKIWRSDRPREAKIFEDRFPPSPIQPGTTVITAEGVFDEVGDRRAGVELANIGEMVKLIRDDWDVLLRENPLVTISYEVDGEEVKVTPWTHPELVDKYVEEDITVVDSNGRKVGNIEKIFLGFSKAPLKGGPPPAIAICTNQHAVTYQQIYGGPNANKLFGYAKADFLAPSETTNHLAFKSTRNWRLVREMIAKRADDFMRRYAGMQQTVDPKTARALSDTTGQINELIRLRFQDWHPEGGFVEKRKTPKVRTQPWIRDVATDKDSYEPGEACNLSFQVVNPSKREKTDRLEVFAAIASPKGETIYSKTWLAEIPADDSRLISDIINLSTDAIEGQYIGRISLINEKKATLDERKFSFELGESEAEEKDSVHRKPRKTKKTRRKHGEALKDAGMAKFPLEEDLIRESAFDRTEHQVFINTESPTFGFVKGNEEATRYHFTKCQLNELAELKLERDLGLLAPDEMTKEKVISMMRALDVERATFLAEWAKLEAIRTSKMAVPLIR